MSSSTRGHTELLADILRGDTVAAARFVGVDLDELHDAVVAHDVLALLAEEAPNQPHLPQPLRQRLQADAQQEAVVDMLREVELKRTLQALADAGVQAIIMKGSHLAYTHFARPDLRSRLDSDLLIVAADRERTDQVFTQLGYRESADLTGEFTATQKTYRRTDRAVVTHQFDVHWRLTNAQAFAHVLSYDDVRADAVGLPMLAPSALAPSNVHALVIACMHRVAHHDDEDELKWFVDIDLLASRLSRAEWEDFVALVSGRRIAAVCRHSLLRTVELLRTEIPDDVLNDSRMNVEGESSTLVYLESSSPLGRLKADLRSLGSWRDRARLVREHLLPPEEYMRRTYAPESRAPLAWLYVIRVTRGLGRWLRKRPRG